MSFTSKNFSLISRAKFPKIGKFRKMYYVRFLYTIARGGKTMYNGYNFNSYQNYQLPNYQYGQQLNQMQIQPQPQNISYLNGKVVDGIDVVKVTDVPIGGYGIYPKADLSEIYVKSWNQNGTTSVITYKIQQEEPQAKQDTIEQKIIARIDALESTISGLINTQPAPVQNIIQAPAKREELNINNAF